MEELTPSRDQDGLALGKNDIAREATGMPALSRLFGDGMSLATTTAVAGTVFIAIGAFWLSFTSLSDLARRSGLSPNQAWAWPLIVDGIIVVATVAVVVLAGSRAAWYPWTLLFAGATVSVAANAIHAVLAADRDIPTALAASVAAVPPLVLLAITHLTTVLARAAGRPSIGEPTPNPTASPEYPPVATSPSRAVALRESGLTNRAIAQRLGVHPSTVGRWLRPDPHQRELEQGELTDG